MRNMQYVPVKKVICSFHPDLLQTMNDVAFLEMRTRSELIRQAVREYMRNHHGKENITGTDSPSP